MAEEPKPQSLGVDLTDSVNMDHTEKRFEVDPHVAEKTKQTTLTNNMQASVIQNDEGKKIDLGQSLIRPEQGTGEQQVKQERKQIPIDFFYPADHIQTKLQDSPITNKVASHYHCFGFDSFKKYNVNVLDRDTIIFSSGITYTIYNYFTKESSVYYSKDGGGIGSIAVHPSYKYYAIAEKGSWPCIYIYEYPSNKLYRILRKGTEKSYSNICFSMNGNYIGSVGSSPDYLLCVWDWLQEVIVLKAKAFSQEVYRVSFNKFNENALTTSGMGHIKFWKIAETFTGLKLQGEIAKFGQIELSDVTAYIDFQDGKILSSSQYGRLLLWEGNLIKCVIGMDKDTACHNGAIEVIMLKDDKIITAGVDGYIRFWDYSVINQSESDEGFNYFLKPLKQFYFQRQPGVPAHILYIAEFGNFWIVQDALGKIWKFIIEGDVREPILETNSGKFNDIASSPINNCTVSAGADGFVRLWDYGNRRQFCARNFKTRSEATCIEWVPYSKRNAGRLVVAAFSDGLIRFLLINQTELTLIKAEKVHKNKIIRMKCSPDGAIVATVDKEGDIFFTALGSDLQNVKPYCLFETGFKINDICWDRDSKKILLACKDGRLHEINVPRIEECDTSETYLRPFQARSHLVKMMESQKPKKQDLELQLLLKKTKGGNVDEKIVDEQWQPSSILNAVYYDKQCSKVLCCVDGKFLGHLYIVDMSKQRPSSSIPVSKKPTCYLGFEQYELLVMGFRDGTFQLRHKFNYDRYMQKDCYDKDYGKVRKVVFNYDRNVIISASEDGTMFIEQYDSASLIKSAKSGEPVVTEAITFPSTINGINEVSFIEGIDLSEPAEEDIGDSKGYSIQERKLKAEEDNKMSEADKAKKNKRNKVKELQHIFKEVIETNKAQVDEFAKLTPDELTVDPEYVEILHKQVEFELEETRKELEYDEAYSSLLQAKIQNYMIDELLFDKFGVQGVKLEDLLVTSFKLKKMPAYVRKELDKIEAILKQEQANPTREVSVEPSLAGTKTDMKTVSILRGKKDEPKDMRSKIKQAEADFEKQLAHAVATKGNYKLKSSKDYVVPEHERMNVSKKKKHMFLHFQFLYDSKRRFNQKLLDLKNRRAKLVQKINRYNETILHINTELTIDEQLFKPKPEPQTKQIITNEDIEEYAKQKAREKEKKPTGGMGGMGGASEPKEEKKERKKSISKDQKPIATVQQQDKPQKGRKGMKVQISDLETQLKEMAEIRLLAQKKAMNTELQAEISEFDRQLTDLKNTKIYLQTDLKLVQMKLITYYQQFLIFRDMQDQDNRLLQSLNTLKRDKDNYQQLYTRLTAQIGELQVATDELRRKLDEDKKIFKELVFPDDDEKREKILKYYKNREKKRLNKAKKQTEKETNQEDESQDSDEEEEESEPEDEDQYDEDEEKPDITPIETDHKNYDLIRRMCEHDEKIEENGRLKSELEKQRNQANSKIRNILGDLQKAEALLTAFQRAKLLKVNKLDVSYPIKLSQVQNLIKAGQNYAIPQDLTTAILFTFPQFQRLSSRIRQLAKQKQDIETKQQMLQKQLARLKNEVTKASLDIEAKKKDYEEKQLLKFGDIIDLKILDALEPTRQVLDMRDRYKLEEKEATKRVEAMRHQLQLKKKEMLAKKRENTRIITEITELGEKHMELDKNLDSTNKQLFRGEDEDKKNNLDKEKQNLLDLIKFLSKEIDDLKTEIGLFKRKGGHIYTMVTSNKRNTFL